MTNFQIYFPTGFTHILDLAGADHILFIAALCLGYSFQQWKKILILITAFTVGHSLTLALSTLHVLAIPQTLTEFLIALTIFITSVCNIVLVRYSFNIPARLYYFLTLTFGCIHGLGFSSLLMNMLGKEQSILGPLFFFNLGLEAGQLIIVGVILLLNYMATSILRHREKIWLIAANTAIAFAAMTMMVNRISF